jgi:hypothetical protein
MMVFGGGSYAAGRKDGSVLGIVLSLGCGSAAVFAQETVIMSREKDNVWR